MSNWYILQVKGGSEEFVCEQLNQMENLKAFVVKKEKLIKKQDNYIKQQVKLFPSYIFVESDIDHLQFAPLVLDLKTRYYDIIAQLRHDLDGTSALDEHERQFIAILCNGDHVIESSCGFMENDQVIITDGPLMGLESSIKYIDRHKRIAKIELNLFNEVKEIVVSLEIISKK